ncbi:lipopolysaccharide assembly protein LapB [Methylophilaceae bacterium]|jgi:lipopolysaccharide biosynthesis regulator YciM|nr:MAG: N-acetylglucosaminyl transferase [Methylophilales bacterium BACL14 MAG-120910-bin43]KRP07827.1 MAG: N-acetylglucosaminyl transferase [Methylophilales bacterium BACL14 MAG-120920-bin58]MBT6391793.1 lipopolysaccharide assembly protein LapB [Nitrosomonadales bacterium]MDA7700314.1 lipopolysaccharide assembly protein LapB [Methylophilaceae bacterium]|tara:strand:+ start:7827 stop:9005 length:1179 start_codon:yes stop_codon:yes gene_type:complete
MVEFEFWWLLVIPFFFGLGWIAARIDIKQIISESTDFPAAYFKGIHYLITNQYEKATESFSEAVKANDNSMEIHFALGSLLRRTGQIDKAISLHLDLLENREMNVDQQESVKAELAQDYFKAGLYDRSEELLLSLTKDNYEQFKLNTLLEIYVKERDWEKAVKMASQLEKISGVSFRKEISHYYCEMAVSMIISKKYSDGSKFLLQAIEEHKNCVRANILLGDVRESQGMIDEAISYWRKIEYQKPEYLGLVASKIIKAYQAEGKINDGLSILSRYYDLYNLRTLLNVLYEAVISNEGPGSAEKIARNELIQRPSLLALDQLFQALAMNKNTQIDNIELIQQTIKNTISIRRFYVCNICGFKAKQFHWQCPACNGWESLPSEPRDIALDETS